jgi:hypothetical protein
MYVFKSPLIGIDLSEKTQTFCKSPCEKQVLFTLSMQLSYLSIAHGRRNNKRTKKKSNGLM